MWYCVISCHVWSVNCDIISQNITYCFGNYVAPPVVGKQILYCKTNLIFSHLHSFSHAHLLSSVLDLHFLVPEMFYTFMQIGTDLYTCMQMRIIFQGSPVCLSPSADFLQVLQLMTNAKCSCHSLFCTFHHVSSNKLSASCSERTYFTTVRIIWHIVWHIIWHIFHH